MINAIKEFSDSENTEDRLFYKNCILEIIRLNERTLKLKNDDKLKDLNEKLKQKINNFEIYVLSPIKNEECIIIPTTDKKPCAEAVSRQEQVLENEDTSSKKWFEEKNWDEMPEINL